MFSGENERSPRDDITRRAATLIIDALRSFRLLYFI